MMLVRTPAHQPTESLLGYVLRLSETNGYDTPWHVLNHAGIAQGTMLTASLPVSALAKVLGRSAKDLDGIAYSANTDSHREFRLLGHPLGHGLNTSPLRLKRPAICPHCIAEHGYIDAFFDLNLAVACPHHKCELLTHCPGCKEAISWFRPGLLTCKCGASLAQASTVAVSDALADLMTIIWAVLHRFDASLVATRGEWPVRALLNTPLRVLSLKIPDLGWFQQRSLGLNADAASPKELLDGASSVLSNWPHGFHDFLGKLSAVGDTKQLAFGKRFELFSKRFFSVRPCGKDFIWLRDEFVRFGLQTWGESVIDQKMLRNTPSERRYISKSELARRLNVSQATLANWVKTGRIELKTLEINGNLRYVADTEDARLKAPEPREGTVLDCRDAAAYLGIPVSVLKQLKAGGQFVAKHHVQQKMGFHQADLDNFKQQLAAVPLENGLDGDRQDHLVSLAHVLSKYRFHGSSNKADLVAAYLTGELVAAKRDSGEPRDIFFFKPDVEAFVSSSRCLSAGGSYSLRDAAKIIGCDPIAVPKLIDEDYLKAEAGREGARITSASLDAFTAKYVALSDLARGLKTSARRLLRLCDSTSLPLMQVKRNTGSPTSFILREDLAVLKQLSATFPARRPKQTDGSKTLAAVMQYLAGLRLAGHSLPLRGGKPAKTAIAEACGIDRSAFYKNQDIARLIDEYAASETGVLA